ncbi:MAG: HEAT repeat domain-containing protein [Planctomycetota bacterium]|nr:HEAT repeat domain-containing protein [Planctomycetota bacterium]
MMVFFLQMVVISSFCGQLKEGVLSQEQRAEIESARRDLKSSDPDIIYYAACSLIRMAHKSALEVLKEGYEKGEKTVRLKIVKALGDKRDRVIEAVGEYLVILKAALMEEEEGMRKQLVQTLVALKSPVVTSFMLEEVKKRPQDTKILKLVVDSFSGMRLEDMVCIGHLIELGGIVSDTEMRGRLLVALNGAFFFEKFNSFAEASEWYQKNKNRSYEEVIREQQEMIRGILEKRKSESEMWRRLYIETQIKYMKSLSDERRLPEVLRLLEEKEPPVELKEFAIREVGSLKAKEHQPKLMPFLSSTEDRLCIAALEALSVMGAKEAIAQIDDLLKARSPEVRLAAVKALVVLTASSPSPTLVERLKVEEDVKILEALIEAVDVLKVVDALGVLLDRMFVLLEGGVVQLDGRFGVEVRKKVVVAVGKLSALVEEEGLRKRAVTALIASLGDPEASVRFHACERLGVLKVGLSQGPLVLRLKEDKSPGVRAAAARALGLIANADEETLNALKDALNSSEKEVVEAAVEALRNQCGIADGQTGKPKVELLSAVVAEMMTKKMFEVVVSLLRVSKERLSSMGKEEAAALAAVSMNAAKAYEQSGDLRKASGVYESLLGFLQGKDSLEGRSEYARLLMKQSMFIEALAQFDALLTLVPERQTEFWHKKLDILESIGEKDEKTAKQVAESFIKAAAQEKFPQEVRERLSKVVKRLGIEYTPPVSPTPPK